MYPSEIDTGLLLGTFVKLAFDGFRKKSVTIQITNNKSITLTGKVKVLVTSVVLAIVLAVFLLFIGIVLVIVGIL